MGDRVTSECARFLLSQLDLASCLDLRSMPGVAPELFAIQDLDKDLKTKKDDPNLTASKDEAEPDSEKSSGKKIDLMDKIDDFIECNMDQLSETRQLRALPRICMEVLHLSKEERDAVQHPRPLCELALDWTRNQWLEDDTLTLEMLANVGNDSTNGNGVMITGAHPAYSPSKTSREGSINGEDLVYASVEAMSQGKCGVGAEIYEGKLIVCGGYDRGECLSGVEMFDFATNSWSSMKPMNTKRGRFGVAKITKDGAETLYAVAGSSGQMEESSVEKYDTDGNWKQVANLP